MPTFSVHTLGCRANQSDSERLIEILSSAGYREVAFGQPADCQIVNTCTVTRQADVKSAQLLRRAERLGGQVVATGCGVAQRGGLARRLPASVLQLAPEQQGELLARLGVQESCPTGEEFLSELRRPRSNTRALLRIQDGCDQFCTFCIVPYVRGRSRSLGLPDIIEKVRQLETSGCSEIVLTGIHLSVWGHDLGAGQDLASLLEALLAATVGVRFRLGSVEPDLFPERVFALMRTHSDRLCPHLHLVLQHSSDRILKAMHRGYDRAHYDRLVEGLQGVGPGAGLTTDVMVGFPGETEAEFADMLIHLESLPIYRIHAFPYSPRPGTAAARFEGRVHEAELQARMGRLLQLAEQKRGDFIRSCLGQTRWVVLEGGDAVSLKASRLNLIQGTADNYLSVLVPTDNLSGPTRGRVVPVKLIGYQGENAIGEILAS